MTHCDPVPLYGVEHIVGPGNGLTLHRPQAIALKD